MAYGTTIIVRTDKHLLCAIRCAKLFRPRFIEFNSVLQALL